MNIKLNTEHFFVTEKHIKYVCDVNYLLKLSVINNAYKGINILYLQYIDLYAIITYGKSFFHK